MAVKAECPTLEEVFTFEDVKGARHWTEVAKAGWTPSRLSSRPAAMRWTAQARDHHLHVWNVSLPKG